MRYPRLAYDDTDRGVDMRPDCDRVLAQMGLSRPTRAGIADRAVSPTPSILFEDARESPKRDIRVSEAAARLASTLHLHLD
ncbi:MAG: hypothetical protein ACR2FG_01390 [Marmoricola sp.]